MKREVQTAKEEELQQNLAKLTISWLSSNNMEDYVGLLRNLNEHSDKDDTQLKSLVSGNPEFIKSLLRDQELAETLFDAKSSAVTQDDDTLFKHKISVLTDLHKQGEKRDDVRTQASCSKSAEKPASKESSFYKINDLRSPNHEKSRSGSIEV